VTEAEPGESHSPNVYINGLPPNFPEEQLYALIKDFGGVVSVRTFTRHVSDRPSGYGFVLFETIESAEKCIEALRRYRNLHPSFCKNLYPIPGTRYASLTSSGIQPPQSPSPSGTDGDSFKARMERLKDETSTNLCIEGLPLNIDETTMSALVAPHAIKSSRFFQTRLSHPPRTIAFVRLETRAACDEIIKRLHGRMVRGWNDPGSRISVRFADSAEQRELRRTERSGRGDDSSPARLTMAQAALLNLRGQQMQGRLPASHHPNNPSDQRRLLSAQSQADAHDLPGVHYPQHNRLPPHPICRRDNRSLKTTFF
jgi:RNA recognition motif-containing protein